MPSDVVRKTVLRAGVALVTALLCACASPPADDPDAKAEFEQLNDPLEPTNRAIFEFNDTVDVYFLRPVAQGYRQAVPPFGRARIADFLDNMKAPLYFANDLLQGNLTRAAATFERFLLNSTFGVGGIMDVATPMGIPGHQSDFGQTLGVWGVGEGPYLVLPFWGPSNPRDTAGLVADSFGDPLDYYFVNDGMKWASWTRTGASAVSKREAYLDTLDDVKRTSLDYYSALRSLYRQRRNAQINEGKAGEARLIPAAQPAGPAQTK